jgi:hypothetical protein
MQGRLPPFMPKKLVMHVPILHIANDTAIANALSSTGSLLFSPVGLLIPSVSSKISKELIRKIDLGIKLYNILIEVFLSHN